MRAGAPQLVGQDDQACGSRPQDDRRSIAALGQIAHQTQQCGGAESAAHAADVAARRQVDRLAERAGNVENRVARLERADPSGRRPDFLDDDRDRPGGAIEIGNGDRNSFAALADAEHHELSRSGRGGDERRVQPEVLRDWRQTTGVENGRHR